MHRCACWLCASCSAAAPSSSYRRLTSCRRSRRHRTLTLRLRTAARGLPTCGSWCAVSCCRCLSTLSTGIEGQRCGVVDSKQATIERQGCCCEHAARLILRRRWDVHNHGALHTPIQRITRCRVHAQHVPRVSVDPRAEEVVEVAHEVHLGLHALQHVDKRESVAAAVCDQHICGVGNLRAATQVMSCTRLTACTAKLVTYQSHPSRELLLGTHLESTVVTGTGRRVGTAPQPQASDVSARVAQVLCPTTRQHRLYSLLPQVLKHLPR